MNITDVMIEKVNSMKEIISQDKHYGLNLPEKEFIKGISLLTPQSYGFRIENYINNFLGSRKVPSTLNQGDIKLNNKYIEIKGSIITNTNSLLNMVQIRLYQKLDYYLCCAFDIRDLKNFKSYYFLLTHSEMVKESKNSNAAHGTKISNADNKNIELRMSLPIDNNDTKFQYWVENYSKTLEEVERHIYV